MKSIVTFLSGKSQEEQFEIFIKSAEDIRNEEDVKVAKTLRMIRDNWDLIDDSNKNHFASIVKNLKVNSYINSIFCDYFVKAIENVFCPKFPF